MVTSMEYKWMVAVLTGGWYVLTLGLDDEA